MWRFCDAFVLCMRVYVCVYVEIRDWDWIGVSNTSTLPLERTTSHKGAFGYLKTFLSLDLSSGCLIVGIRTLSI